MGGGIHRLALLYVQQGLPVNFVTGSACQSEVRLSGITMGGTGHGSKLNTRIAYIFQLQKERRVMPPFLMTISSFLMGI